jgi:hypothetical protein
LVAAKSGGEVGDKLAAEHFPEHRAGEKESIAGTNPAGAIGRKAAGRNEAMQMGVMQHSLIPGVKHS